MEEIRKRRRVKTARFDFDSLENEEQKVLQQVMRNSLIDTQRREISVPDAPTFYPTVEEFENPLLYIKKMLPQGEKYGICKIVPPSEWNPVCQLDLSENNPLVFPTKLQNISTLQQGEGFDDGKDYTFSAYRKMADKFYQKWIDTHHPGQHITQDLLTKDYWDIVETRTKVAVVEYGNDLDTEKYSSGFPINSIFHHQPKVQPNKDTKQIESNSNIKSENSSVFNEAYYYDTSWNLTKLPVCDGSVLHHIKTPIAGVNVPWLYIGMLFSSFCWHNEDNYLFSINYSHLGATKQWYGIPGSDAKQFEKASKDFLIESFKESPDLLHHMTTQISPSLLQANGVAVYKASQEAKTFIITFPKAYHCGFSYGFNCGEAVNFATLDWLPAGGEAEEKYRSLSRGTVFSHQRLLFTLLHHLNTSDMPMKYRKMLSSEILKVVNEELASRPYIIELGVRDLSERIKMPPNDFSEISKKALEYDDMRTCCVCNHICIFSAIACECDRAKVTCLRHFSFMCKCSNEKKFLLTWENNKYLMDVKREMIKIQNEA